MKLELYVAGEVKVLNTTMRSEIVVLQAVPVKLNKNKNVPFA